MLSISQIYEEFLKKTSQIVYEKLKSQETNLYFEKSMIEKNPELLKRGFQVRCKKLSSLPYGFYCTTKYNIPGLSFQENFPIPYQIFYLINQEVPESLKSILGEDLGDQTLETASITQLLYCLLIDILCKGIIYTTPRRIKNFSIEKLSYNGKIFEKEGDMDAMQVFLRTIIWDCTKKYFPYNINLWKLHKNPISLVQNKNITLNKKVVLLIMQDKRGIFGTYIPLDFVIRFFQTKKNNKAYFFAHEGTFFVDLSKEVSSIRQLATLMPTRKARNQLIKQISYMLKMCEIYDDVLNETNKHPIVVKEKQLSSNELKEYLSEVFFHLPSKNIRVSSKQKNTRAKSFFESFLSFLKKIPEQHRTAC